MYIFFSPKLFHLVAKFLLPFGFLKRDVLVTLIMIYGIVQVRDNKKRKFRLVN